MIKQFISDTFQEKMISRFKSWDWVHSSIAEDFLKLKGTSHLQIGGSSKRLWETRHKFVLCVTTDSGKKLAYKSNKTIRVLNYLFHLPPTTREAINYQRLQDLGLPMAKLLAVGETRCLLWLKSVYLVTEFADGYLDGRVFHWNGSMVNETALRDEFIVKNVRWLAKIHDAGIIHRGFTPANILWKKNTDPTRPDLMDVLWIDVASNTKLSPEEMKKELPDDLGSMFHFFEFTVEERKRFLKEYLDASTHGFYDADDLFDAVEIQREKHLKARKTRVHFVP
ncbi:MAG: hypothetical protein J6W81_00320 [Lentisphaeria bacterium]|nr:hypothetical protein [Lentisphaeria bacterium]